MSGSDVALLLSGWLSWLKHVDACGMMIDVWCARPWTLLAKYFTNCSRGSSKMP